MKILRKISALVLSLAAVITMSAVSNSFSEDISPSLSAGKVATSGGRLNVRSSPSTSGTRLIQLINHTEVILLEKSGGWWYICYGDGKYGYVSADYIVEYDSSYEAQVTTQSGRLNVRSGRGTGYAIIDKLDSGTRVAVIESSGGWCRILYDGISTGYVSSDYLTKPGVMLSVPSYKQTDSRWSYVTIGSSGKTIGKIGCALTCVSMTESYRTGDTLYPSYLAKTLNFSSDGSLYWPAGYVHSYGGDWMSKVRSLLDSGKPVILCARTSSYSTHFVVVTGYKQDGKLSADDFYINDPGSKYRTTLEDLFEVYPYFYKITYYS